MELNLEDFGQDVTITKTHVYIQPHLLLRCAIAHYTILFDEVVEQNTSSLLLVPDAAGCIVIQDTKKGLECIFWGGTTTCVKVHTDTEHIRFRFFVEFLPIGAYSLFHQNQAIYLNEKLPLHIVHPKIDAQLREAYEESGSIKQFVDRINTIFLRVLLFDQTCAVHIQHRLHNGESIENIVDSIGYSRRHMQRIFQEQSGCTMKQYQRIERINRSIQHMQITHEQGATLAQSCGYYDEAHFIHDFKSVMQVSPKKYKEQMSIFYNEAFKF